MELTFKVCNNANCGITITDYTQDQGEYAPDSATSMDAYISVNRWKYRDTITINLVEYHPINGSDSILHTSYNEHFCDGELGYLDEAHIQLNKDGYYTIHHIVLPTEKGMERMIKDGEISSLDIDIKGYWFDNDKIYTTDDNNNTIEVSLDVLKSVNTEGTSISRQSEDFFSICYLWQCYIKLSKAIFNNTNFKCAISKVDTFSRDFVWMTLNIIKYHVQFQEFMEAQRILESINGCSGFCENISTITNTTGCGCSR